MTSENLHNEAAVPAGLDLDLKAQVLTITWADGAVSRYPADFLRARCPCAACRTRREQQARVLLPVLSPAQSAKTTITGGSLVGHYAVQLEWSDGHNTGIYDFRLLRALAGELPPAEPGRPESPHG